MRELWDKAGGFINEGPFTPFGFHEAGTPPKSYLQFPGVGSPNWGGTAADPSTGYVSGGTSESALTGLDRKEGSGRQLRQSNGRFPAAHGSRILYRPGPLQ